MHYIIDSPEIDNVSSDFIFIQGLSINNRSKKDKPFVCLFVSSSIFG